MVKAVTTGLEGVFNESPRSLKSLAGRRPMMISGSATVASERRNHPAIGPQVRPGGWVALVLAGSPQDEVRAKLLERQPRSL